MVGKIIDVEALEPAGDLTDPKELIKLEGSVIDKPLLRRLYKEFSKK